MTGPFVSVLIDTYNHERFIEAAIRSVLEQDFPAADREVIVVDDGSTDRTPELVAKFTPQVRHLRKANGGQASAFNAGIPECRGEIIAFLDGDDWWAPGKLRRVVDMLAAEPSVGLVGHGITEVYADGRQQVVQPDATLRLRADSLPNARLFRLRKCFLGTSRMTIRKTALSQILPVPESLCIEADEFLFTLAAVIADVLILTESLTFYRLHSANLYQAPGFDKKSVRQKCEILSSLAVHLTQALHIKGIPDEITGTITEEIRAESEQLRLALEFGWPWETVQTELCIFRIQHEKASLAQRVFKFVSLVPAFALPSRWYYSARRKLAANSLYLRARAKWLPPPRLEVVQSSWKGGQ